MRARTARIGLVGLLTTLCVVPAVTLALVSGCSGNKAMNPKVAPETTVFVQGPVDTVSYKVHLYWFGSDPDGYVVAYELRFKNPDLPADTAWVRTTKTDSIFEVFTPTGVSKPIFQVRAIDDDGMTDATPAQQSFTFQNLPPVLLSLIGPGSSPPPVSSDDTTFATATISYSAADPDGDISRASYRVWLDGNAANPLTTTATTVTIPTAEFLQGGQLLSGFRKVFVQVIDGAGYAAKPESLRWFVRAPAQVMTNNKGRLLIIDDVPGSTRETFRNDTLYVNTATRNLPAGTFSILRLQFSQPFRSTKDLEQTLKLFDCVLWYRGTETTLQPLLSDYRDGVASFIESGGSFYIESQFLVAGLATPGIFPEDWVPRFFGSDSLHTRLALGASQVNWGIAEADAQNNPVILHSPRYGTDMRQTQIYGELRGFAVRDTHDVAAWARTGNLTQGNTVDIPVAVTVAQPSGGRVIAVTFPIRSADGFNNDPPTQQIPRFLAKAFEDLGLTSGSLARYSRSSRATSR